MLIDEVYSLSVTIVENKIIDGISATIIEMYNNADMNNAQGASGERFLNENDENSVDDQEIDSWGYNHSQNNKEGESEFDVSYNGLTPTMS